tara:strand:+ start:2632 stop:2859 length:228 start_codon:yes stop_codon:yes gene_type:complete
MPTDFDEYIKVKNINLPSDMSEPYLLRLRIDDQTFAHIDIRNNEGSFTLQIHRIDEENKRRVVKWVNGLHSQQEG